MQFSELSVGDQFKVNGVLHTKIQQQKVSCCKVLNALNAETNKKVMIKPVENVEKVTSDNQ